MKYYIIDLIRIDGVLYGVTEDFQEVTFKPGNRFVYEGDKYRVGLQGNYFNVIPMWYKNRIFAILEFLFL